MVKTELLHGIENRSIFAVLVSSLRTKQQTLSIQ